MKVLAYLAIVAAAISLVLAVVQRILAGGMPTPGACLDFTDTCLLAAIALLLVGIARSKAT